MRVVKWPEGEVYARFYSPSLVRARAAVVSIPWLCAFCGAPRDWIYNRTLSFIISHFPTNVKRPPVATPRGVREEVSEA